MRLVFAAQAIGAVVTWALPQPEPHSYEWSGPKGPIATLLPALKWNHDGADLTHLRPGATRDLFYTHTGHSDPTQEHMYASMVAAASVPVVVLEHSSFVSSIKCSGNGIDVGFISGWALEYAELWWNLDPGLIFTTHASDCGDGQRDYWLANSISYDYKQEVAHVKAKKVDLPVAIHEIDLEWGTYQPSQPTRGSGGGYPTSAIRSTATMTSTSTTDLGCTSPTAATISGFPAAPCGDGFDDALDKALGYLDFSNADFSTDLKDLAPGLCDDNESDYDYDDIAGENYTGPDRRRNLRGLTLVERRKLQRRWGWPAIFQKVVNVVKVAGKATLSAASTAINTAVSTAKDVGNFVKDVANGNFGPSVDTSLPLNIVPTKLTTSPWGDAYSIFHKDVTKNAGKTTASIDIYCVQCGVTGQAHIAGGLKFSIRNIGVRGNLLAQLNIGIAAEAEYRPEPLKKNIVSTGLPGFSIPKVIVIGPELALDVELGFDIRAQGQVLAGAALSLPDFNANLDVVDSSKTVVSGFKPQFKTNFSASGEIQVTSRLGLPLTLGIGIDIVPLGSSGRKLISMINDPAVEAVATFAHSSDGSGDCNNGVAYSLAISDDLKMDFFGTKQVNLFTYTSPDLVKGCKQIGSSGGSDGSKNTSSGDGPNGGDGTESKDGQRRNVPILHPHSRALQATNSTSKSTTSTSQSASATSQATSAISTNTLTPMDNNPDSQEYQNMLQQADNEENKDVGVPNEDGFAYGKISSKDGNYLLSVDESGSVRLSATADSDSKDEGLLWGAYGNVTVSDDSERVIHYYPDLMAKYGVSRFRVSDNSQVPKSADIVTLVPYNYDSDPDTKGVFFAIDSKGALFYTVACNLQGEDAKVFLVKDPIEGAHRLEKADLQNIVTGGVTSACAFVPFVSNGQGLF